MILGRCYKIIGHKLKKHSLMKSNGYFFRSIVHVCRLKYWLNMSWLYLCTEDLPVDRPVQPNELSSETIIFSSQSLNVKTWLMYFYIFLYVAFNILLYDKIYNQLVPHILQNWFLPFYFLKISLFRANVELVSSIGCEYPG